MKSIIFPVKIPYNKSSINIHKSIGYTDTYMTRSFKLCTNVRCIWNSIIFCHIQYTLKFQKSSAYTYGLKWLIFTQNVHFYYKIRQNFPKQWFLIAKFMLFWKTSSLLDEILNKAFKIANRFQNFWKSWWKFTKFKQNFSTKITFWNSNIYKLKISKIHVRIYIHIQIYMYVYVYPMFYPRNSLS